MAYDLDDLILLMDRLRDPESGCPWDLKQTFETIIPHTLEEAYEVAEAIHDEDWNELRKELGDFVFQAIFYSKLADEQGWFNFHDVIDGLVSKMLRRHPHVFPNGQLKPTFESEEKQIELSDQQLHEQWNQIKAQERQSGKNEGNQQSLYQVASVDGTVGSESVMNNIPETFPALLKAWKLQKKAASVGFDWDGIEGVKQQLLSELDEVEDAHNPDHIEEELGDLLFCCVNLARHHKVHPEIALMKANAKFERRFRAMETLSIDQKKAFSELSIDEKDALWKAVKLKEISK